MDLEIHEEYRTPDRRLLCDPAASAVGRTVSLRDACLPAAKLSYYARRLTGEATILPVARVLEDLFRREGRERECAGLIDALDSYEVVHPGMFLIEEVSGDQTRTLFAPRGEVLQRIDAMAAACVLSIRESPAEAYNPAIVGLDYEAVADRVYAYLRAVLVGPFSSIVDVGSGRPILVLNDMSYTTQQIFRAFSGVYCDDTPVPSFSKVDFLLFSVHHEIAHQMAESVVAQGARGEYIPGVDLGVDAKEIARRNEAESISDAYAALKHIQSTGSTAFPKLVAAMRTLCVFSQRFVDFETDFTLRFRARPRRRSEVEHYTAPAVDLAIERGASLYERGALQRMGDSELMSLAIDTARIAKLAPEALRDLLKFATTLTFNVVRRSFVQLVPKWKDSISPTIVEFVLNRVEAGGSYTPRGGSSLEDAVFRLDEGPVRVAVSRALRGVFQRYREALQHIRQAGIAPLSEESKRYFLDELKATLDLPGNQLPNTTLARALNDSMACEKKVRALTGTGFDCVGVRLLLEESPPDNDALLQLVKGYSQRSRDGVSEGDVVISLCDAR